MTQFFKCRINFAISFCIIVSLNLININCVTAQSGWEAIKKNDNIAAKRSYLETLKKDSTDINALFGMIYLAELEQDDISNEKYSNSLVNNHKQPEEYLLFGNQYIGDLKKLNLAADSAQKAVTDLAVKKADDLFSNRKFDDCKKAYSDIIGDYNWSVIGPFKNISGYGFVKEYNIEKEKFSSEKTYDNGYDLNFKWVNRNIRNYNGIVNFSDNLGNEYSDAVYFANTYITVPETVKAQFRIARNTPVKIWLDDDLIFQNKDNTNFSWDNEIVNITLTKGIHRLLVKCASLPSGNESNNFLSYYDGGSYHSSNNNFSDFNFGSMFGNFSYYDVQFAIRITGIDGALLKNIQSSFSGNYSPANFDCKLYNNNLVDFYKKAINKSPEQLMNYFFLLKAYMQSQQTIEGEEYFVKLYRKNTDVLFYKYLAAKMYAANGKSEKAYLILNDIDENKTPLFALIYEDLNKLDKDADEKEYVKRLNHMDTIFPSNMSVIKDMITYFQKKGMNDDKKKYVKDKMDKYPSFKEELKEYLEDDNYKPYEDKPETDKERKQKAKEAINNLKTKFDVWDYETAITHYKNIDKPDKAFSLYDELISIEPYVISHRTDKADYLYTKEKYDDAITLLNGALEMSPYSTKIMETLGDIYSDKKDKEKALDFYKRVLVMKSSDYDRKAIQDKIEKLQEKDNIKDHFATKSFDEILKDDGWKNAYTDDKSVVLMYTKDVMLDKQKTTHYFQKLMVKILTEDGARVWTESDFSFMGELSFVKVIKKNGAEINPDKNNGVVVFKDLEPGDIIQMEGTYTGSIDNEIKDGFFMLNYLSFDVPVYYAKVEIIVPEDMPYNYDFHKVPDNVVKKKENGYQYYTWEFNKIAKAEEEEAVYDKIDPYAYIWGTSIPSWSEFVEWYKEKTYRKLDPTYEVKEVLDTIIKPGMTQMQKVEAVYNFVTEKINYSYVSFLQSNFIPKRAGLTCSAGIGDCKDVATLMISMLHYLGIESYYTLVKTNKYFHKFIMPSLLFDHVIVAYVIDGKMYWADPTSNYYPYYSLNENDANSHALLIKDGNNSIMHLFDFYTDTLSNTQEINITAELKEDKSITINADVTTKGIEAGYLRETINPMTIEEQRKFIPEYFGEQVFENLKIESFDFGNLKDISNPLKSTFKLSADNYGDKVTSMLIFRIPLMKTVLSNTLFKKEKRYSAIDLSKVLGITPVVQKVKVKIPVGYKLIECPQDVSIESRFGKYELKFKPTADGIEVSKTQVFKNRVIEIEDFDAFKQFYLKIQDADETKLSIKKG
jgi:lipopolysaccharide biosynthesis regulator YciM